jgi:hypothetical protein
MKSDRDWEGSRSSTERVTAPRNRDRPILIPAWVPWLIVFAFVCVLGYNLRPTAETQTRFAETRFKGNGPAVLVDWLKEQGITANRDEREALTQLDDEWTKRADLQALFGDGGKADPVWLLRWGVTTRVDPSGVRMLTHRPVLRNLTNRLGILTGGSSQDIVMSLLNEQRLRASSANLRCMLVVANRMDIDVDLRASVNVGEQLDIRAFARQLRREDYCPRLALSQSRPTG